MQDRSAKMHMSVQAVASSENSSHVTDSPAVSLNKTPSEQLHGGKVMLSHNVDLPASSLLVLL
jgi:hypothetical protein